MHGAPAFRLSAQDQSDIPVIIAVPHAGRDYPQWLIERLRNPAFSTARLEDRHADSLAIEVARRTGAALLVARAPRALIDLNRDPGDVDWDMFGEPPPGNRPGHRDEIAYRARGGLGLIPRRLPGLGELWKRRHDRAELAERIAQVHAPYHHALDTALTRLRNQWGGALLIDLHSMPPLPARPGHATARIVLGDRFGVSCHGRVVAAAFAHLAESRQLAAHNRPYAGGYVLDRHGDPAGGVSALQIEVDRSCYLDAAFDRPGPGFAATVDLLSSLVRVLAAETAALARAAGATGLWQDAAE